MTNAPPKDFRPFDFEQAKQGAPIGRGDGLPIRVLCWDRLAYSPNIFNLVTLVKSSSDFESVVLYNHRGCASTQQSLVDLVMLPLDYVEGKPVYIGDELEYNGKTFQVTLGFKNHSFGKQAYAWPKSPVMFKGRELKYDSVLWNKPGPNAEWSRVHAMDHTTQFATIFDKLKADPEGYAPFYEWEKPKVKREVWQARCTHHLSPNKEVIYMTPADSKKDCETIVKNFAVSDGLIFIKAELISTYYE